nr:acyltransferase family protein [Sulfuriferula plumbiphila]
MKAIGIVLVVLGHSPGLNEYVKSTIYGFHMPLFFFISGLLLSDEKRQLKITEYFILQTRALGIPYLFFWFVSYLYWLPTHTLSASAGKYVGIPWWKPIEGVFIGNGNALYVNVVLWFFTCLFTTSLIYFIARKFFSYLSLLILFNSIAFAFTLFYDKSWPRTPMGLDNAVVALAFFSAGHSFRQYQPVFLESMSKKRAIPASLFLFSWVLIFTILNGEVDLNTMSFGNYKILYFLIAYLGIFSLYFFSISIPNNLVFKWLSKNTIIIFPVHLLMFSVFTGIAEVVFGMPHSFRESSVVWTVLFAVSALLLSYPASLFLYRYFPNVFGGRKKRQYGRPESLARSG